MFEEDDAKETTKKHGDNSPVSRRSFVKALGTTGGIAVGATGFSSSVTGSAGSNDAPGASESSNLDIPKIQELHGRKRLMFVIKALRSEQYRSLQRESWLENRRYVDVANASAFRIVFNHGDEKRVTHFVKLPLKQHGSRTQSADEQVELDAHIGIPIEDGDVQSATALRALESDDDTITLTMSKASTGSVTTTTQSVDPSTGQTATGPTVQQCITSISPAQACGFPGKPPKCEACMVIAEIACEYGCGLGGIGVCYIAGKLTSINSVFCSLAALEVCHRLDGSTNCNLWPARVCYNLGYCRIRPL